MIKDDDDNEKENLKYTQRNSLTKSVSHEVLFAEGSSSLYSNQRKEASYEFDYEINSIRFGEEKDEEFMYSKIENKLFGYKYKKIDPSENLYDSLKIKYDGDEKKINRAGFDKMYKANIFKRLVSKKKRRIQTPFFDLDMAYITERVIGMGFPATGCEIVYRNSLTDIKAYLDRYHEEYKIYNLCIEKKRIYPKSNFGDKPVGLFPFNDHSPCPIKLILDFCVDLCLYLTAHPRGVAAIHCKAGKGRTGVMIACYLLFSGLCDTIDEALIHYAYQRTLNNKGVTIPSQIRYIKYFESYLDANFERPYIKCIPKMIKLNLNSGYTNMICNYTSDMSYFTTVNCFKLKSCTIGPFSEKIDFNYSFGAITRKKLNFENSTFNRREIQSKYYYEIEFNSEERINYDIKLQIKSKTVTFYSWFNLWYNTFNVISEFASKHNNFESSSGNDLNTSSTFDGEKNTNSSDQNKEKAPRSGTRCGYSGWIKRFGGWKKMSLNKAISLFTAKRMKGGKKKSAVQTLKSNKDLNVIFDGIEELASEKGVEPLDRKNLSFVIDRKQLDKLKTKCKDPFKVKYTYELLK